MHTRHTMTGGLMGLVLGLFVLLAAPAVAEAGSRVSFQVSYGQGGSYTTLHGHGGHGGHNHYSYRPYGHPGHRVYHAPQHYHAPVVTCGPRYVYVPAPVQYHHRPVYRHCR